MDRKEIVKKLGEHFEVEPKYMGVPTFAYQIETGQDTYTVDRQGGITTEAGVEMDLDSILNGTSEVNEDAGNEITECEIVLPMGNHSPRTLRNLVNSLFSKQELIKKAIGTENDIVSKDFVVCLIEDFDNKIKELERMDREGLK